MRLEDDIDQAENTRFTTLNELARSLTLALISEIRFISLAFSTGHCVIKIVKCRKLRRIWHVARAGRLEMLSEFLCGNLLGSGNLEEKERDDWIALRCILEKQMMENACNWLRIMSNGKLWC